VKRSNAIIKIFSQEVLYLQIDCFSLMQSNLQSWVIKELKSSYLIAQGPSSHALQTKLQLVA